VVTPKFIEEQPQILRLTPPRLKSTPGAPFAQDDSSYFVVNFRGGTPEAPMNSSAPLTFKGITPGQYAVLVDKANAAGLALNGNSGTASRLGVEVAWSYTPESGLLSIQCLRAPFFMKAEDVNAKIEAVIRSAIAATPLA